MTQAQKHLGTIALLGFLALVVGLIFLVSRQPKQAEQPEAPYRESNAPIPEVPCTTEDCLKG